MADCQTSVIVSIYNSDKYLEECLRSLAAQTVDDYEVILIDDGSTDRSAEISQIFADLFQHFRCVRTANLGPGAARNLGLSLAKGEFIAFVDSDDWVSKNYLAALVEPLRRDPELDVAVCGFRLIAEDGSDIPSDREKLAYLSSEAAYLHSGHECYPWNKCFRRTLFTDRQFYAGRFDDLSLIPYLLCAARKLHFVREVLYQYRQHAGSLSTTRQDEQRLFHVFPAIDHLKQRAAHRDDRWSSYELEQLPNHAFAYRVRELLSLAGRGGGMGLLNRYSKSLERTLPGWARSPATRRWLQERLWWKRVVLRLLVASLSNRALRPLALATALAWRAAQPRSRIPDQSPAREAPDLAPRMLEPASPYDVIESRGIAVAKAEKTDHE